MIRRDNRDFEKSVLAIMPCKPGDRVFIIDTVDCKAGECPDARNDTCPRREQSVNTEVLWECKQKHPVIRGIEVGQVTVSVFGINDDEEYGVLVSINDTYDFIAETLDQIKHSYAEAAALIRRVEK